MKKCISIAPELLMQMRTKEWQIALCAYGAPLFVANQSLRRFMTGGIYIVFWQIVYRKPRFFCFWTVYRGLSWISRWTCAHRQLPCRSFFRTFLMLYVVFIGFLMCNEGWFLCIAIIMTSDFLLDLMFYRSFDGIVFCRNSHWNFLRCGELSF